MTKMIVGVDVGGTNIQTALCEASGRILQRNKSSTPFRGSREEIMGAIIECIETLLKKGDVKKSKIDGLGLAVPGLVEYRENRIAESPNMSISGQDLVAPFEEQFGAKVALVNDCDAATMGEKWLGAARAADTAIGLFVGTGIGGGIILDRRLLRSDRYSLSEVGHMILQLDGPLCGCGNRGCLEAMASRTAMEKNIREAMQAGEETVLHELLEPDEPRIRSGVLKQALERNDRLVTRVLGDAADILGYGCMNFRHLFDPSIFVFGGGVIEACGDFFFPRIEKILQTDPFMQGRPQPAVVLSALGDDAGALGAAAAVLEVLGEDPFQAALSDKKKYPRKEVTIENGVFQIEGDSHKQSVIIRQNGRVKSMTRKKDPEPVTRLGQLTEAHIKRICKGGPWEVIFGSREDESQLPKEVVDFLNRRAIRFQVVSPEEAVNHYEQSHERLALALMSA